MSPSWYDLLGVEPDASAEEIRAAWKTGIADLDPSDRRFRVLNEAAEVLLDPDRRAAYDAELGATVGPHESAEPSSEWTADRPSRWSRRSRSDRLETPAAGSGEATETAPRRGVPGWVLAGLAVLTVLMVAAASYLFTLPSDVSIDEATSDAQAAAERSVVTILSYDYRTLDEDQAASGALMTDDYRKDYDELFAVIKENAEAIKPVVSVQVVASGVVRSGQDRVQVLVFVNRPTTRVDGTQIFKDQVRMTMVSSGSDWLVDDMETGATPS